MFSDSPFVKPTVMAEPEQSGYIRPRYYVTVTGELVMGMMVYVHETHR